MMEKAELIEAVEEAAARHGLHFRQNYGGRGMYGAECLAVDYDDLNDYLAFWASLTPDVREALGYASTDNMGTGTVAYFRKVQTKVGRFW